MPDERASEFNASRFIFARKRKGYSQVELAEKLGITNRAIVAYETREYPPAPDVLSAIEQVLEFPASFYWGESLEALTPFDVSFRSLSKMSARQRDVALSQGELAIHFSKWIESRFELPKPDLPDLGLERKPEAAAEYVRSYWQIGQLPVRNVVHLLEAKGVRVFSLSVASPEIDAISTWKGDTPYVFLNTFKSSERSRFDAAHELGHLILHKHGGPQGRKAEHEANAFASAFLMPRGSVVANAPKYPSLPELLRLKKVWGVSLAALNYRLHQLKLVSDWQYRALSIELGKRGYRVNEPNEGERETSAVLPMVFSNLYENDGLTRGMIAQELDMLLPVLESVMFSLVMTGVQGGRPNRTGSPDKELVSIETSQVTLLRVA